MLAQALTLGFSAGFYCVGTCAPLVGPLLLVDARRGLGQGLRSVGYFLSGRFLAYGGLGFGAGIAGQFGLSAWGPGLLALAVIQILLGILLLCHAAPRPCGSCASRPQFFLQTGKTLFVAGFLSSLSLCPPLLLAVSLAVEQGNPLGGFLFFLVFFGITSFFVLPFSLLALKIPARFMRWLGRTCCAGAGIYFILRGIRLVLNTEQYIVF